MTLVLLLLAMEMAGAALGSDPQAHPSPGWVMAVPAYTVVTIAAAASVVVFFAMESGMDIAMGSHAGPSTARIATMFGGELNDPAAIARSQWMFAEGIRLAGVALALIPLVVFGARIYGSRLLSGQALHPAASVLVVGVIVVALDAMAGRSGIRTIEGITRAADRSPPPVEVTPADETLPSSIPPPPSPPKRSTREPPPPIQAAPAETLISAPPPPRGGVVLVPSSQLEVVHKTEIPVPEGMIKSGQRAIVMVAAQFDEDGHVTETSLLKSGGFPMLDQIVLDAVGQWRFRPYALGGRPVPVKTTVAVVLTGKSQ